MIISGYSLVAINQVYNVQFEWFSKLNQTFISDIRNTSYYDIIAQKKNTKIIFEAISSNDIDGIGIKRVRSLFIPDFKKYIYVYCSLGEVNQFDSSIKVIEMAQRGNTLEIIAAVNITSDVFEEILNYPDDIVRIEKNKLIPSGELLLVLKNQYGAYLSETTVNLKSTNPPL
jgi:hypothetical protein